MVNASRSPLGLGTDEQLLQVVPRVRTRIESQWTDQVDQGPAARRIEFQNQLIWTHRSKTKVAPTPMKKASHTTHAIQLKPTNRMFDCRCLRFDVVGSACRGTYLFLVRC